MRRRDMLAALLLAGCAQGELGVERPVAASWSLVADEDLALVEEGCAAEGCPVYPNPDECLRLDVRVSAGGRMCGTCVREGFAVERCGGSEEGLPYDCSFVGDGCVVCVDLFGNEAHRTCPAPEDDFEKPTGICPAPRLEACDESPEVALRLSRERFALELNTILEEAGLWAEFVPSVEPLPEENGGPASCGDGDGIEETEDEPRSWTRNGKPRCGFILKHARHRAKDAMGSCKPAGLGRAIATEVGLASIELRGRYDCVGSPIVLDLDGDGIESRWSGARFDLAGIGELADVAWIEPGDALLAIDRDGDGRIADGTELFGDAAAGDGFAALRSLDGDADGAITVRDATFSRLLLWTDDGDARTEGGELSTLDGAGIVRIDLDALASDRRDGAGSLMALWSTFVRTDGTAAAVCDVFFAER